MRPEAPAGALRTYRASLPTELLGSETQKGPLSKLDSGPGTNLAASYSPTELPLQYHRPWRTLLPCSGWERVWPLRHSRQKLSPARVARQAPARDGSPSGMKKRSANA